MTEHLWYYIEESLMKKFLAVAAAALSLSTSCGSAVAATYTLTDFGVGSVASAINAQGQVVGAIGSSAVIWNGSAPTFVDASGYGYATGINESGQIVGLHSGDPVIWDGANRTALATFSSSHANAINASGQVVGHSFNFGGNGVQTPIIWSGTSMTALGTFGGVSNTASAINASGQIVGSSSLPGDSIPPTRAVIWNPTTTTPSGYTAPIDLGTLGGIGSAANGINASGQVVGDSSLIGNGLHRAFIWDGSTLNELGLGALGGIDTSSNAFGINASGQVVGEVSNSVTGEQRAVIWDGTTVTDLNTLMFGLGAGWVLSSATGINDAGQIIGVLSNSITFQSSSFLLTPAAVPIPAAAWLMVSGIGALGAAARRRKAA